MAVRDIKEYWGSEWIMEGAGVKLKRAFGFSEIPKVDPFLLLDDFNSENPDDYTAGFPWHPHRGIETISYLLHGELEHGDSMGNKGVICSGDVQWMTAGSGIVHQEMPQAVGDKKLWGFQLWSNLPASHKMMEPRYQDIKASEIPTTELDSGVKVRVVCGEVNGAKGPVTDIITDPEFIDVTVPPNTTFTHNIPLTHNVFAYTIVGEGYFDEAKEKLVPVGNTVLFDSGDSVCVNSGEKELRFLLVSGKPIEEPIAWRGPIVMNTDEELDTAFEEYNNGTFIK